MQILMPFLACIAGKILRASAGVSAEGLATWARPRGIISI